VPEIRPVRSSDRGNGMHCGRATCVYRQHVSIEVTTGLARRVDERVQPHGLVAERTQTRRFVHYVFHPTTWSLQNMCYLEDLFAIRTRGSGVVVP